MKKLGLQILLFIIPICTNAQVQQFIFDKQQPNSFSIADAVIYVDANDIALLKKSAQFLQQDIEAVIGKKLSIVNTITAVKNIIIIGSIQNSSLVKQLLQEKKINTARIKNKWEACRNSLTRQTTVPRRFSVSGLAWPWP